jgi:zinc protease
MPLRRTFLTLLALSLSLCASPLRAMSIETVTGKSGVTAWLVEDPSLPVVTIHFAFAGGAALDPSGKGGVATMAAALLDDGAGPYGMAAFQGRLADLASAVGFDADQDNFLGTLRTLKKNLAPAAEMLRLALMQPRFAPDAIERVRSELAASLSHEQDDPRALASLLWMRAAFAPHPYARNIEGTPQSIAKIDRDDLLAFVSRRLVRAGLVIGVVGDVTPQELAPLLDRVFGGLPAGMPDAPVPDTKPAETGGFVVTRRAVPQSVITFGQAGPKRDDPDWYAALVVDEILGGGGFRGRLMRDIREKRGLAYGASATLEPFRHAGLLVGNVATENKNVAEVVALVREEWRHMHDEGPSATELAAAKSYLIGSFPLTLSSTGRVAAVLVAMQVAKLPIDYLDRRAALIGGVSLDEARRVARQMLDPTGLSFVVVGNPAGLVSGAPASRQPF